MKHVLFAVSFLYAISGFSRELSVLNLNLWAVELGIPEFIAKSPSLDLEERTARLPKEIAKLQPDIVIFEEVWNEKRAAHIEELLKPLGYAYAAMKSEARGWILRGGNGLLIVSKLPLDPRVEAMSFSGATRWDESFLICKKGAIKTRVELEPNHWVDLYATHLGATSTVVRRERADSFDRRELAAQSAQIHELIDFIARTHTSDDLIMGADLNSHPFVFENGHYETDRHSDVYRLLTCADHAPACLHLKDGFDDQRDGAAFSYDTVRNRYAHAADFAVEPPGRIDYTFTLGEHLVATEAKLVITEDPISDHYGLQTKMSYEPMSHIRLPSNTK